MSVRPPETRRGAPSCFPKWQLSAGIFPGRRAESLPPPLPPSLQGHWQPASAPRHSSARADAHLFRDAPCRLPLPARHPRKQEKSTRRVDAAASPGARPGAGLGQEQTERGPGEVGGAQGRAARLGGLTSGPWQCTVLLAPAPAWENPASGDRSQRPARREPGSTQVSGKEALMCGICQSGRGGQGQGLTQPRT